jgi:hypothetical protein
MLYIHKILSLKGQNTWQNRGTLQESSSSSFRVKDPLQKAKPQLNLILCTRIPIADNKECDGFN